ncbi:hypothetical protein [Streptomyces antimycoticus]|nr:hypothetical protein [Streptomyces antimycoticus]
MSVGCLCDDLVVAVPGTSLGRDESTLPGTTLESLAGLSPSFRENTGG